MKFSLLIIIVVFPFFAMVSLQQPEESFQILFESGPEGNRDLYIMNADGSHVIQLTNQPGDDHWATLSPDQQQIAFVSNQAISVINLDGTGLQTPIPVGFGPVWSPDGRKIAYTAEGEEGRALYTIDLASSTVEQLTGTIDVDWTQYAWSPDGQFIAFVTQLPDQPQDIYIVHVEMHELYNLTNTPFEWEGRPRWSPDSTLIAFNKGNPSDKGGVLTREGNLPDSLAAFVTYTSPPTWSPDGQKMAFAYQQDIYIAHADGTEQVNLTQTPEIEEKAPMWSPDSQQLAMLSAPLPYTDHEIHVIRIDGSDRQAITNIEGYNDIVSMAWSPDRQSIAITVSALDGGWEIYRVNTDGTNQINLTNNSFNDWNPIWISMSDYSQP